jgi:hypothetical protein
MTIEQARRAFEVASADVGHPVQFGRLSQRKLRRRLGSSIPLSRELAEFWGDATPVRVAVPFAPDRLDLLVPEEVVTGHAGYLGESWNPAWVLIGDVAGDPVIAETSRPGTPIMLAIHGSGPLRPTTVAPSPAAFLAAVAAWLRVLKRFDGERLDEDRDFEVKPGFDDAFRSELRGLLPEEHVEALMTYINI